MTEDLKLWLLRPVEDHETWIPWYDKTFGLVVRATTEEQARSIAQDQNGDETYKDETAWISSDSSTCEVLTIDGEVGVVIEDIRMA